MWLGFFGWKVLHVINNIVNANNFQIKMEV